MRFKKNNLSESIKTNKHAQIGFLSENEIKNVVEEIISDTIYNSEIATIDIVTDERDADDWDEVPTHLLDYRVEYTDMIVSKTEDKFGQGRYYEVSITLHLDYDMGQSYIYLYFDLQDDDTIEYLTDIIKSQLDSGSLDVGFNYMGESLNEALIRPKKGEHKETFISRFMSNDVSKEEFPDNKQRFAVCMSIWERAHK